MSFIIQNLDRSDRSFRLKVSVWTFWQFWDEIRDKLNMWEYIHECFSAEGYINISIDAFLDSLN